MKDKIDEIRNLVNQQSKVIKHLQKELKMTQLVLGYEDKKASLDVFFETLKQQGVSEDELLKNPGIFASTMRVLRRL